MSIVNANSILTSSSQTIIYTAPANEGAVININILQVDDDAYTYPDQSTGTVSVWIVPSAQSILAAHLIEQDAYLYRGSPLIRTGEVIPPGAKVIMSRTGSLPVSVRISGFTVTP